MEHFDVRYARAAVGQRLKLPDVARFDAVFIFTPHDMFARCQRANFCGGGDSAHGEAEFQHPLHCSR